jgi:hypothetical protein
MRHRIYCIPTTQGSIEVTKGTFLTFNKRNTLKKKIEEPAHTVNKLKAIKKCTINHTRPTLTKLSIAPVKLPKKISLSSSLHNS